MQEFGAKLDEYEKPIKSLLFSALKDRSKTLVEFAAQLKDIQTPPKSYDEKMLQKVDSSALGVLAKIIDEEEFAQCFCALNPSKLESYLHNYAESSSVKIGKLMPALRLALLGKGGGIGVCEALLIIGQDQSIQRIQALLAHLS